jgi:hypothetical protein
MPSQKLMMWLISMFAMSLILVTESSAFQIEDQIANHYKLQQQKYNFIKIQGPNWNLNINFRGQRYSLSFLSKAVKKCTSQASMMEDAHHALIQDI